MILVRQNSDPIVSIAPEGFEDYSAGRMWVQGIDTDLVEGYDETPGCDGAYPAVYRLVWPAMLVYDDPFCAGCGERYPDCVCWQRDLPHQWRLMLLGPEEPESWLCRFCGKMWTAGSDICATLPPALAELCPDRQHIEASEKQRSKHHA